MGRNITKFAPGEEVYGTANGTFAEYTTTTEALLSPKPTTLTHEEAATVPISGSTALQAIKAAKVKRGDRVLILGATGGVGGFALQPAKHTGAHVTAVCSTTKLVLATKLGANEVIDHTRDSPTGPYDVILDTAGNRPLRTLRNLLTPRGTAVLIGAETQDPWFGGVDRTLRATLWTPFLRHTLVPLMTTERAEDFTHLATLLCTRRELTPTGRPGSAAPGGPPHAPRRRDTALSSGSFFRSISFPGNMLGQGNRVAVIRLRDGGYTEFDTSGGDSGS
ncbi:NADPH:quinone reductase-like Zn-dependent oxidoreductase [Crossiella equi]|uniref:NADPH:quinone reductase-like Zn-dependent oxidoreductase n=1 Tax=Crossiella equi TaxID=130796 RepID=A0ABS5A696_9PSEU|nr:NAD(P)-dependent alcohol dehydrogenase [Crossiella equi]MBP2471752.1 NADPH:quinone reductase-like Zn-dependent oxidoreductase [Crossiella equi]